MGGRIPSCALICPNRTSASASSSTSASSTRHHSAGGLVKYDPANPSRQKTQPIARTITQVRASYISYVAKLTKMLGGGSLEDDDDDLDEYE